MGVGPVEYRGRDGRASRSRPSTARKVINHQPSPSCFNAATYASLSPRTPLWGASAQRAAKRSTRLDSLLAMASFPRPFKSGRAQIPNRRPRYDICAAVVSDLEFDARVWKEARSLASRGYRVSLLGCTYELSDVRRSHRDEIAITEVPLGSRLGKASAAGRAITLLRLWREILRTSARAYHAHNVQVGPPAWLAARIRGVRLVYDAHELYGHLDPDVSYLVRSWGLAARALERFMVRASDEVITTNHSRADELTSRHGREGITVLANVPPKMEDLKPLDPGYPPGRQILLYQGGIYARSRAFREAIEAMRLLKGFDLVIIGFGRQNILDLLDRWAREQGVADRVHYLGPRPFDELVRTAASATVGLVPIKPDSPGAFLGDTNKLHEYLMAGLPVVASDLPEIRRVVTAGDPPVGELFDAGSPAGIAAAVSRVVGDKDEYQRRRAEARRIALECFNWEIEERHLLALYSRVFADPAPAPV